jgi:hypothetical protein
MATDAKDVAVQLHHLFRFAVELQRRQWSALFEILNKPDPKQKSQLRASREYAMNDSFPLLGSSGRSLSVSWQIVWF